VSSQQPVKKIIHVDMDAFYASVEQRDNPSLRGRPVIVGGDPQSRGVVASCSYEARKFGVRSAISSSQAKRLCPQAVFVEPDFSKYKKASEQIQAIFHRVTPLVEPLSLDEAYLDVTVNLLNEPIASKIAAWIKERIRQETGLTASAGVGPNKFIAKVASDIKKPNGLVVIPPEKVLAFVEKLPVERLWGVGPVTAKRLKEAGLHTAGDLRQRSIAELEQLVGSFAHFLHGLSLGEDDRPVESEWEPKSTGTETTFARDILDTGALLEQLEDQAEGIARDLRQNLKRPGKTITLKLRYADFKTITRSKTLRRYTDQAQVIYRTASELLLQNTDAGREPVRLIGISVSGLFDESEPEQLWLDLPLD